MKKNKRLIIILIIIIITILGLIIYDNLHYSKREILKIINRVGEDFSTVHITIERYDFISKYISVNEIYGKDNVIYDYTYSNYLETDEIEEGGIDIWDFETKKRIFLNHTNKTKSILKIKGRRTC